jgi:hypothetical protein
LLGAQLLNPPTITTQEDETLRKRIKSYGLNNWGMVADGLPGRSGKSCSERCVRQPAPRCDVGS